MGNKIRFGLENVHIAYWKDDTSEYDTPLKVPGAVSIDIDTVGDTSTFYADNVPYATSESNGGYTGTIEMAVVPDDFLINALGFTKDTNGLIVEDSSIKRKSFALMYEVSGNEEDTRFIFYNVTASRPKLSAKTKEEGVEVQTASFEFTATVREVAGKNLIKGHIDSKAKGYAKFMEKVLLPNASID